MAKTRLSISVSDEELNKALTEILTIRARDFCLDMLKDEVMEVLKERYVTDAIEKKVYGSIDSYDLKSMYKDAVRDQVRKYLNDGWGDISKDVRKMIEEEVKEALDRGRLTVFIRSAIEDTMHNYVERVFNDFNKGDKHE